VLAPDITVESLHTLSAPDNAVELIHAPAAPDDVVVPQPRTSGIQTRQIKMKKRVVTPKKMARKGTKALRMAAITGTFCLFWAEIYLDPPTEDWIQCRSCNRWCHEQCAYTDRVDEDNNFVCGVC